MGKLTERRTCLGTIFRHIRRTKGDQSCTRNNYESFAAQFRDHDNVLQQARSGKVNVMEEGKEG